MLIILRNLWNHIKQNRRYALILVTVLTISFTAMIFFVSADKFFSERKEEVEEEFSAQAFLVPVFYSEDEDVTSVRLPTLAEFRRYGESSYLEKGYLTGTATIKNPNAIDDPIDILREINADDPLVINLYDEARIKENYESTLLEGNLDLASDECLVSSQFADINDYHIGDSIITTDFENQPLELRINGIFEMDENQYIDVVMSLDGATHLYPDNENMILWDLFFILNHSEDLRNFQVELREKGLPRYYQLETNQEFGEWRVLPIYRSQQILASGTIVSVCLSILLLFFSSMLFWKRRVYQTKYLYTIGFTRKNIIVQELITLTIFIVVSLLFAYLLNLLFAQSLSERLFDWQKSMQDTQLTGFDNIPYNPLPDTGSIIQPLKDITVVPIINVVIIGMALVYLLILSIRSVFYILRFKMIDRFTEGSWYD